MDSTVEVNKNEKQLEGKEASSITSILRIVFAVILIWLGASMVSVYQIAVLYGFMRTSGFTSLYQGEILQTQTLVDWYSRLASSSAIINNIELFIWILIPGLLIVISLILLKPKSLIKMAFIGLCIGVVIYGAAVVSNKFDAEQRKNSFLRSNQGPQKLFDSIKYPGVATYFYKDYNGFDDPSETSFTFSTNAGREEVINFYLAKGFISESNNEIILAKRNVYVAPGGQKISWVITITDENDNLKIKASTNDHWY